MISFLSGRVAAKGSGFCVIDVGGVGFRLAMSTASIAALPTEGDDVLVHTYLHVREDDLSLFGFESEAERYAFEQLITVSGVGPKVALAALSALDADALATAIAAEDVALISSVPGIGKKTAQRIVLDLAGKLVTDGERHAAASPAAGAASATETTEALLAMGFTTSEAAEAMKGFSGDGRDANALLRYALQRLGGAA